MALTTMANMLTAEHIPAVIDLVLKHVAHENSYIRKKVMIVLMKIIKLDESYTSQLREAVRTGLCDSDPAVMGASLSVLEVMIDKDPESSKDLVPALIAILRQV